MDLFSQIFFVDFGIFVFAQIVNYVLLLQVWKQKVWNRKREIRVILALSLAFILLVVATEELLDRLDKIRLDEGTMKGNQEGRKCFIHLRGKKMYKYGSSWGYVGDDASGADTYWQITLNEDGTAYYGEEYYEIKGNVDWDGLYELALSEYYGVNRDLYLKWLGLE